MKYNDFLVLHTLVNQNTHGYGILQKINNHVKIQKITLYKILERLEKVEYIEVAEEDGKRKVYSITSKGLDVYNDRKNYFKIPHNENEIGKNTIYFESIDSTNKYCKENKLEHGTIVYTSYQSQGKGRMNRVWEASENKSLLHSYNLLPNCSVSRVGEFTQLAAASIYSLLKEYNIETKIKWPNDILINDKKIAGILIDTTLSSTLDKVIIGIGLNVNQESFSDLLSNKATSMYQCTNQEYDIEDIMLNLSKHINIQYNNFLNNNLEYIDICRDNSYLLGKTVYIAELGKEVEVKGISQDGRLIIEVDDCINLLSISEISLENIYNK